MAETITSLSPHHEVSLSRQSNLLEHVKQHELTGSNIGNVLGIYEIPEKVSEIGELSGEIVIEFRAYLLTCRCFSSLLCKIGRNAPIWNATSSHCNTRDAQGNLSCSLEMVRMS